MYWPGDGQSCGMLMPGDRSQSAARRSGSGYGSGRSNTPSTALNIVVDGLPGRVGANLRQPNHLSSVLLSAAVAVVPLMAAERLRWLYTRLIGAS